METVQEYSEKGVELLWEYGPKIVTALLILIIGSIIVGVVTRTFSRVLKKQNVDESLRPFLRSLLRALLVTLLVIVVASQLGIEMTSFVAILGAAGLAIGLALQGTLQNFAGGVMILLFKPYRVGDVIEAQGFIGSVKEIQIFVTILHTWDKKVIIIPNGKLSNDSIINYSKEETRVVEWIFGIGYEDDIDKARKIIEEVVFTDERVLDEPGNYFINISELGDSSVNFKVRANVQGGDYWQILFDMNERVKKAFDSNGISIPFPQRDVHLYNKQ